MDIRKPEDIERPEQSLKHQTELAETKIRAIERAKLPKPDTNSDVKMTDKADRPITVRTWENEHSVMVRAYDTDKVQVPERADIGQAGHAEATIEHGLDGHKQARLTYIETTSEYRNSGIAGKMLDQVEQYAKKHGATEIYGSIENQDAQNYWRHQVDHGWNIDSSKGYYGEVHKKL